MDTPLLCAVSIGKESIVRLLLQYGANIDTQNAQKWTALSRAAFDGNEPMVRLLLQYGANTNTLEFMQYTPRNCGIFFKNDSVVRLFMENGIGVNTKNIIKNTPLDDAKENGDQAIITLFEEPMSVQHRNQRSSDSRASSNQFAFLSSIANAPDPQKNNDSPKISLGSPR
jgi:ankyrin repeat protein